MAVWPGRSRQPNSLYVGVEGHQVRCLRGEKMSDTRGETIDVDQIGMKLVELMCTYL